jgi:hypothetical protein
MRNGLYPFCGCALARKGPIVIAVIASKPPNASRRLIRSPRRRGRGQPFEGEGFGSKLNAASLRQGPALPCGHPKCPGGDVRGRDLTVPLKWGTFIGQAETSACEDGTGITHRAPGAYRCGEGCRLARSALDSFRPAVRLEDKRSRYVAGFLRVHLGRGHRGGDALHLCADPHADCH